MINLHVYPSPITHESRIEREVATIRSLDLFSRIEVAGVSGEGLPDVAPLGAHATVRRFAADATSHTLAARVAKTLAFGRAVVRHYSQQPLTVINCHSVAALPACVALKKATGARMVYDTHELETETAVAVGFRRPLYKLIERRALKHIDHTFTVTRTIEDWYRRTYGLTAIDTLYNFPSQVQSIARYDKHYFQAKFGLTDGARIFLYQGVLGHGRGLETLAEVFRKEYVPDDARLVILGYGALEAQAKSWARQSDRIFYHPAVSPNELAGLTNAADVGLALTSGTECLSYYYSAPNKIFQYWHAGVPVIASPLPEHRGFLARYPAGVLTESDSVESVIEACRTIYTLSPETTQHGLREAQADLRWENYTDLINERYKALASRGKRRSA